jgi:predicted signal transduction protein with EAL and GGDEF domain
MVSRNCSDEDAEMIARLGGDEFTVLLEYLSSAPDASKVARRILEELSNPFEIEGSEVFITASIGISVWPDDCQDAGTLIKNADMAMYHAKEIGRNNFQYFNDSMNIAALQRLLLETNLRKALSRGEFFLHYQPKISLPDGRIYGVEALARWESPELGRVSPGTFIPLAEETNLITAIDDWVLEEACQQLKEWESAGLPNIKMAVNISGRDLDQHDRLIEKTTQLITRYGISPHNLEYEITEGVLMNNAEKAIETFKVLRDLGISLSIDDFGTGYSSLSYLIRFPVNTIKIDQSFVREVTSDAGAAAIVKAIITLAQNLSMDVIAEGVETREQMEFLYALGCTEMQGYYLGFPVPAEAITRLLKKQN